MAQVSYGTITITDTTDLTTYIRYATKAPLTAASQFQETPTTDTRYIAVLSIPTSDSIPDWKSDSWNWSEFIGTDGLSVKSTRTLYYLKINSANVPQVDKNTSIVSVDIHDAWTSKNPTYIANGTYWTCLEVTLSDNTTKSWSAPAEDLGLTQVAKDAAETKTIVQHANEDAQGALGIARAMQQNFWWWGEDHTVDSSFTLPAGAYTSDIKVDAFKVNPTGGYLVTRSDGVYLNNGRYVLMGLTGNALKFYRPGTTKLLSGTETVDAELTSNGLKINNGSIVLGSTSGTAAGNVTLSNVNFSRSINSTQRDDLRLAIGSKFGVSDNGTLYADGANITNINANNISTNLLSAIQAKVTTLSTITANMGTLTAGTISYGNTGNNDSFYLSANSSKTATIAGASRSNLRLTVGSGFGVDINGKLYATGADINGEITATALTIESKATVSGLSTTDIDGMSNYALQEDLDSEITQRKAIYAVSTTEATIPEKTTESGTPPGFVLYNGATVTVKFNNGNSTTTPTLSVNGTDAKTIKSYIGAALTEAEYTWPAGATITFTYDGSYWCMQDSGALQAKANANDAKELAEKTDQHFWVNGEGVHITKMPRDGAVARGNTLITNEGMEIRDGNVSLASFRGDGVEIGKEGGAKTVIRADGTSVKTVSGLPAINTYAVSELADGSPSDDFVGWYYTYATFSLSASVQSVTLVLDKEPHAKEWTDPIDAEYPISTSLTFYTASGDRYWASTSDFAGKPLSHDTVANKSDTTDRFNVTIAYDGSRTITVTTDRSDTAVTMVSLDIVVRYYVKVPEEPVIELQGTASLYGQLTAKKIYVEDGEIDADKSIRAGEDLCAGGSVLLGATNISEIFSGVISIGYEDKSLNLAAGGNTGESTINLSKNGYSARCICGWNLSGTGSSNCTIAKIYVNQTDQQAHYYVKNTGSSKATPTLRIYILYTKSDLPQLSDPPLTPLT